MNEKQKIIEIALNEVGYIEKASNSNLDDKTANAGSANYTKYARDLDNISGFYNGKKNGYDWCDVFFDWCFVDAVGVERALELLCQPEKSAGAGCTSSANYYKNAGQFFTTPQIGDQIFFTNGIDMYHTGLVYNVDSSKVYTIEGNTKPTNEVVSNGGMVCKKSYPLNASYIGGYGRPKYSNSAEEIEEKQQTTSSNSQVVLEWQKIMNKVYGCGIDEDNKYEEYSKTCANKYYLYYKTPTIVNDHVGFIQERLISKGFSCGPCGADRSYGPDTESATKAFQKANGLAVDGYVGAKTTELLLQ